MRLILCALVLLIFKVYCFEGDSKEVTSKLISNLLVYKKIEYINYITCAKQHDAKIIKNDVQQLNIFLNYVRPKDVCTQEQHHIFFNKLNIGFLLDLSCQNHTQVLYTAERCNLYSFPYKWFLIDTSKKFLLNYSSLLELFQDVSLGMDSDITVAILTPKKSAFTVYDVYKTNSSSFGGLKVTLLAHWTPATALDATFTFSRYTQRKNMTNTWIKWGIVKTHPDDVKSIDAYYRQIINNYDTISKMGYSVYMHLKDIYNFSSEIIVVDKWFGDAEGGVDDGLGALLYERQADGGISPALLKPDRIPFYEFVAPAYPFRSCFIFRNPGTSIAVYNEFLKPFDRTLWYVVFIYLLLFCVILRAVLFIHKLATQPFEENSWSASCLLTWAVFCQQGATFVPKPSSARCTILSLLLMSLLLYNYYTSSIVSSLLSGPPPPFKTIAELSESRLDVGAEDIAYTRTIFAISKDEHIQHLYKNKFLGHNNQPAYMEISDGLAKVKEGGFAYHTEPTVAYSAIEQTFEPYQICELAEINLIQPSVLYLMTQKRSQYKMWIAVGYLRMLETGIIYRERSVWIAKKPACLANTHLVKVGITPLLPAFYLLLSSILISVCLLLVEKILYQYRKN